MSQMPYPVGIIGGGAWGTALAAVMAQIHDNVLIWAREEEAVQSINNQHQNGTRGRQDVPTQKDGFHFESPRSGKVCWPLVAKAFDPKRITPIEIWRLRRICH